MKYVCVQEFSVDLYDDDGFLLDGYLTIYPGEIYDKSEDPFRIIGANDTVHLECENGNWLEIQQAHLDAFFRPLEEENDTTDSES